MKVYYILIEDMYVQAITISNTGFGFIPTWDEEDAGIFEIDKCNAFKNAINEKAPVLKIEFKEYIKEENENV